MNEKTWQKKTFNSREKTGVYIQRINRQAIYHFFKTPTNIRGSQIT